MECLTIKVIKLKDKFKNNKERQKVNLTYITSRGKWYDYSWKGDVYKSGGVVTNIGIHFFDMLIWIFGSVQDIKLTINKNNKVGGELTLENADVKWFLSIDENDLPETLNGGQRTYRNITIGDEELEFSNGFTDLHTLVYQDILNGGGFSLNDARPSIELVHKIRNL
jgi:UDP-N-acetyl-2-amino-2-deoxyglucuronate dehydrogenase